MNAKAACWILIVVAVYANVARSQEPIAIPLPPLSDFASQEQPVGTGKKPQDNKKPQPKKDKEKDKVPETKLIPKDVTNTLPSNIFSQNPSATGEIGSGFNPHMAGYEPPLSFARQSVTVHGTQTQTQAVTDTFSTPTTTVTSRTRTFTTERTVLVPIPTLGAFNIADNESPRPQDRVFLTYSSFSGVVGPNIGSGNPIVTSNSRTFSPGPFLSVTNTNTTVIPGASTPLVNVNREVLGFEKTFLGGNASVEMRMPLLQQPSAIDQFNAYNVGDLTMIGKYAFINDRVTGNVLAGGMALTAPTGPSIQTIDGNIHSTLFQPYVGYIYNYNRFYVQGFHSVVVPTDPRDVSLWFNDVGLNYWLYRYDPTRTLSFVVPTVEVHVATPMNHRLGSGNDPIVVTDLAVMTAGVHLGLGRRSMFTIGVTTPVTAPRPYSVEGFAQLNWRF